MNIEFSTIPPATWESIKSNPKLILQTRNPDFIFKICGVHHKGQIKLLLCPIPNPKVKFSKLQPLSPSDYSIAIQKASALLAPFIPQEVSL